MAQITKRVCEELGGVEISCVTVNGEQWFKALEVAKVMGYKCPKNAISFHVIDYTMKFKDLMGKTKGLDNSIISARYINRQGIQKMLLKSNMPAAFTIAQEMGLDVVTKYVRKEIEIVSFVQEFLTTLNIPFEFQKSVLKYRVDLYLPVQKIAIEIDEFGHAGRDPEYEAEREKQIKDHLQCKFIRFDPDEKNFKISHCIANLTHHIFRT
jgi:very-short-patch-repair endonuclease